MTLPQVIISREIEEEEEEEEEEGQQTRWRERERKGAPPQTDTTAHDVRYQQ